MKLPSRVLFAVAAVAAVAAAVFTASVCLVPAQLSARTLLLAALCGALVLLARRFPIHITEKTKTSVATAPLFAAALLLPLPVALAITSFASAGAEAWRRSRWFQAVFNIGSGALQVAAGGAAVALMGGGARASLQPSGWLPGAVAGAAVFDGAGALLVELMVSVQLRRLVLRQFWQRVWLSLPQEALLLLLGLLLALAALHAPWALPLLAAPVALVYRSLKVMAGGRPPDAVAKTPAHLAQLPRRLQLFIVATGIAAALGSLAVSSRSGGGWTLHSALLAAATAGFAAAAYRLPVKPAPRRTLVLDASFMVVAIAALPSTPALVSVATASLLGNVMLRRPWFNTLFNAAQRTLAGLGGILVMHALVRTPFANGVTVRAALALATAAVVYWLISTALVDLIGAVQLRRNPFAHWFSAHEQSLLAHLLLLPAGALLAPALGVAPWLLPCLLLPAVASRALLHSAVRLDAQASLLVTDLLLAAAETYPRLPAQAERLGALCERLAGAYGLTGAQCHEIGIVGRLAVLADVLAPDPAPAELHPLVLPRNEGRRRALLALLSHADVAEALGYRRAAYDGSSDPAGPRGSAIPISARILGLCERWLQLSEEQPEATTITRLGALLAGAGTRWDPELVGLLAQLCRATPGGAVAVAA